MNRIPKCKPKHFIPHQNNLKITQKESLNEHIVPKITQRNLKFSANRNFGKDISNSIKNNVSNLNSNHSKKGSNDAEKNINNNIYIKKHSSASQVSQKTQKIKISINDKKLRENKSGALIKKKNDVSINKENLKNINLKKEKITPLNGSKLHSSISFGVNNNGGRPLTGNAISVRIPNHKNNKLRNSSNNKIIINKSNNNIIPLDNNNNNKNELSSSNLNIM